MVHTKELSSKNPSRTSNEQRTDQQIKHFVVDTNVLLHNPNALFMFAEHVVVIPFTVLEEIDKFKKGNDDTARNAREVIRHLDRLREKGKLSEGVEWNGHGGLVRIDLHGHHLPPALKDDTSDNRIIAVAWQLHQSGRRTFFISKDINCRIKADAIGIPTEDFEAQKVDADRLYAGYVETTVETALIDRLYEEKQLAVSELAEFLTQTDETGEVGQIYLHANEFVLMRDASDDSHTGLARRLGDTEHLVPVNAPRKPVFGILPRNVQQTMALELLLDDEVKLVTLLGTAGSGKTLLAIAAGMMKVQQDQRYDRLLVSRPIMPMGRDIGYLPGDKDEKLGAWMQPIFDNLSYLLSTRGAGSQYAESRSPEQKIKQMLGEGNVVLEPLTYIRGRSIPHQYMIVDEAQNLTPHEVKTIVSRVGEGTKIVLTGDIAQIDNPYLDSASNGLSYLVDQLKDHGIVGHITLAKSERSQLASLAALKL